MKSKSLIWIVAGVLLLCLCVSSVSANDLHVGYSNLYVGDMGGIQLYLDSAPLGIKSYDITIHIDDPAHARILGFGFPGWEGETWDYGGTNDRNVGATGDIPVGSSNIYLGYAVISGDSEGATFITVTVNSILDENYEQIPGVVVVPGAIYVSEPPPPAPTVTSVSPTYGWFGGSTPVTITGTNLFYTSGVTFDGEPTPSIFIVNDGTINVMAPAHAVGAVDVVVTTPGGTVTKVDAFNYVFTLPTVTSVYQDKGPTAGDTTVTITGSGFTGATAVTFGGTAAKSFGLIDDTWITAVTPLHAAGAVDVVVTIPIGTVTKANAYTYVAAPHADFSGYPISGPPGPLEITFTDLSTGVDITEWNWGYKKAAWVGFEGFTPDPVTHQFTFTDADTYDIKLTVTNAGGSDTETKIGYITVSPAAPTVPEAAFTATPTAGDAPLMVTFKDESTYYGVPPHTHEWNFGDGETSVDEDPVHIYDASGTFDVKLKVIDGGGSDEVTKTGYITVTALPTGSIHVISYPSNAWIAIDYSEVEDAETEETLTDISPGSHTVTVWLDGYVPQTKSVNVVSPGTVDVSFTLVAVPPAPSSPGWKFHADAENTGVYIDTSGNYPTNNVKWSFTTGDDVKSSPAVVDGVVYISSQDGNVYALDATTGAKNWEFQTYDSGYGKSPAVVNDVVYFGLVDNTVIALDAATGDPIWSFWPGYGGGIHSSPVVVNGVVYVGTAAGNPAVYALDAATGTKIWSKQFAESILSSPAVADGRVYVGCMDHKVYALNANTGETIWEYTTGDAIQSSPMVSNGKVYIGSGASDKKVYALDAIYGHLDWTFETSNNVMTTPALYGDLVIVGGGSVLYALNKDTGVQEWTYTTSLLSSSPSVANGRVYIGDYIGKVYSLNADTGDEIWTYTTGDKIYSSPAIANGVLYIGSDDDKVYALGGTPAPTDTIDVTSDPSVAAIYLDGSATSSGPTPATLSVSPGPHTVKVTYDGYFDAEREVTVISGVPASVAITMDAIPPGPEWTAGAIDAVKVVLKDVLDGDTTGKTVSAGTALLTPTSTISLWGDIAIDPLDEITVTTPDAKGYLVFIDDNPKANWQHACRYVFVYENNEFAPIVYHRQSPPTDLVLSHAAGKEPDPGDPGGPNDPVVWTTCTPNCDKYYALLISGGVDQANNHKRYWNDMSFMYNVLIEYGYLPSHIKVLMSDGTDTAGQDRHISNTDPKYDSSPLDLSSPVNGVNDVNGVASHTNVDTYLTSYAPGGTNALSPDATLFIFTTSHGAWDGAGTQDSNNVRLNLWGTGAESYITDDDLYTKLNAITCKAVIMVMEQCYGGGFYDEWVKPYSGAQKRVLITASTFNEYSYGNGFSNAWIMGVGGHDMTGQNRDLSADKSPTVDGRVSMKESYDYAILKDPYAQSQTEHPKIFYKSTDDVTSFLNDCTVATKTLTVSIPSNAGISWQQVSRQKISWTQAGYVPTDMVKITLWNGSPLAQKLVIAASVPATGLSFPWEIPDKPTIYPGSYKIKIESTADSSKYGLSNNFFSITQKGSTTTGGVRITCNPAGADIFLDGVDTTLNTVASPSYVQISDKTGGTHTIGLYKTGYYDYTGDITVKAGLTTTAYTYTLGPRDSDSNNAYIDKDPVGGLAVDSIPGGATVWIGAEGTTPTATYGETGPDMVAYLKPGDYDVYVTKDTYKQSETRHVTVETQTPTRGPVKVIFDLTPKAYTFTGFDAPVDMGTDLMPIFNTAKGGSNIPLKWHLSYSDGGDVSNTADFALRIDTISCPVKGISIDEIEVLDTATATSGLNYQGNGAWHYNWKTDKGVKCYNVYLQYVNNGLISPSAKFQLR